MGNRERAQHSPAAANDEGEPEDIDPAHLADVLESLAQAKRRKFATDATVHHPCAATGLRKSPRHAATWLTVLRFSTCKGVCAHRGWSRGQVCLFTFVQNRSGSALIFKRRALSSFDNLRYFLKFPDAINCIHFFLVSSKQASLKVSLDI